VLADRWFCRKWWGHYKAILILDNEEKSSLSLLCSTGGYSQKGVVWKTTRGWDSKMETIYSAWVNALFQKSNDRHPGQRSIWWLRTRNIISFIITCLLEKMILKTKSKWSWSRLCWHPFFLRAYFAWKLGLPFGFHICDRGYLGKNPNTGQWITNENSSSKQIRYWLSILFCEEWWTASTQALPGLHSTIKIQTIILFLSQGKRSVRVLFCWSIRAYVYPCQLDSSDERSSGRLLAVDAQPDKTIAIKRFWKGNFLFNTNEVVGEPGFKVFRPIYLTTTS